jgi:hypothetical protein
MLDALSQTYERDGFAFPVDVVSASEAQEIRDDLESAELDLAGDPEKLMLLRSYPDRLLPSFDRLIRNTRLIDVVTPILGPDLMVWSSGLFIKEADSPKIVTWHQDLNYWGLDSVNEITVWVALSPSTIESGCMRFVPGSHTRKIVPHTDTYDDNNLLSRGQEIAVEVDNSDGVDVILQSGQASLHHGHLFHSSGPNTTVDRRIGSAIRFISTSMKQNSGDRSLVALVSGEDHYKHFTVAGPPRGRLDEEDFDLCRRDAEIKRRVLYEGSDPSKGKRYSGRWRD